MSEFDRLVGEMEARIDALVDATLERVGQRNPAWLTETAFSRKQLADTARLSLKTQLRAFRRDTLPISCPAQDAAAARTVARVGELEAFAYGYRAGQVTLWEAWFSLIEDSDLEGGERRVLLARGSDFFFRYADLLADYVTTICRDEMLQLRSNGSQGRFDAVKALLEGDPMPATSGALDLDLRQYHLGLIAWGEDAEPAARKLATELGRPLVVVAPIPDICWGWISGARPLTDDERRRIERFRPPAGAGLALGLGEHGEYGFRTTHRQAQRARLLAPDSVPSVTLYSDVTVEALASENPEEARSFIARELGAINDDSTSSKRIRETLRAYFAAEHNAASAAATIGIHQQTVANRLRAAEERLGHPIGARRVELELALRLRRTLGSGRPQDSSS